ncbi:hypothetical protein DSM21852_36340 [Methylocystis bryophila]|uniref:SGNH hydrolase-type esterase domain-containing protein n=2 Tax=Methylocystis bryophila TaxID=655015 RepID=A0A1W6MS47_9HYPH|nr:hypothetical protein B1812_04025 [Methylocystis bryophila]BDV40381.1 hypothetical protein DSM21852_36340 [Methylocystis bryophila]
MFPLLQDQLRYRPWIQIGNADHNNPFSVVEKGIRKSLASGKCAEASGPGKGAEGKSEVIWFYGGSTVYGIGVPWWDTIPSKFVEEADRSGVCIIAVNYGVPYHYSRQEAIYFASNLMNEPRPDAVVFLDGLNEFFQPGSTIRAEPFFTPTLDKLVPVGSEPGADSRTNQTPGILSRLSSLARNLQALRWLGLSPGPTDSIAIREEAYSNRNPPDSKALATDEQVSQAIVDRYLATRRFLSKLCESYGTKCFQFLQPVPAVDYRPQASEVVTEPARKLPEPANRFVTGYSILRKHFAAKDAPCAAEPKGMVEVDLSSLFKSYDGIPYVDYGHYAPRANKLIAAEMSRCVLARSEAARGPGE